MARLVATEGTNQAVAKQVKIADGIEDRREIVLAGPCLREGAGNPFAHLVERPCQFCQFAAAGVGDANDGRVFRHSVGEAGQLVQRTGDKAAQHKVERQGDQHT